MNNYRLLKDLPDCPKGRILKPTNDGNSYFISGTDEEFLNGLRQYKFPKVDVVDNPHWFEEIIEEE